MIRDRYQGGVLVKVIAAGTSQSGVTYPAHALQSAARLIEGRGAITCYQGHERPAYQVGRFVDLAYRAGALWGQLAGADPRYLAAEARGARARGRPNLGVSILGRAWKSPPGTVMTIESLRSIDLDSRSERALAGGMVPMGADGLPIPWSEREPFWADQEYKRQDALLEAMEVKLSYMLTAAQPARRRNSILIQESCGRILAPLA